MEQNLKWGSNKLMWCFIFLRFFLVQRGFWVKVNHWGSFHKFFRASKFLNPYSSLLGVKRVCCSFWRNYHNNLLRKLGTRFKNQCRLGRSKYKNLNLLQLFKISSVSFKNDLFGFLKECKLPSSVVNADFYRLYDTLS